MPSKHIGIVGCSSEGAALCYKTTCSESSKRTLYDHPEVSIHTHSFAKYVDYLDQDDTQGIANLMLSSAEKLQSIGAEVLICPDNTIHRALPYVLEQMSKPCTWLHTAQIVSDEAQKKGYRKLGIMGTKWLVDSQVYPDILEKDGLGYVRPSKEDRILVNRIIMDELVRGIHNEKSTKALQEVIIRLAEKGCDAVVLGCIELPLVLDDSNSRLPTLDSTRLLARAALQASIVP
jgi:aspartate racemase